MQSIIVKYHVYLSAALSIAFVVVVQIFATPSPVFRFLIPAFVVYLVILTGYNYWYLKTLGIYSPWLLLRPLFLTLGWFGLFFIIPSSFWRGVFLLTGVPLLFTVELIQGRPGEQLLYNEILLTTFAGFMTITALSHYYLFNGTIYMALVFIFSTVAVRMSFELTPHSVRHKWVYAFILGMIMTEVFWALNFLPLHFSALGLLLFNVFICVWTITYNFLYNQLTSQKVVFQLALTGALTFIIFLVTPWQILR